ncbi:Crp/Fnr family transcriptional regulator [Rhodobacteraceae bacterium CCMM004]|nr:Crp/Fnr family transcriptional regulator [Rhodobacteraceae bacterium CCMM004]
MRQHQIDIARTSLLLSNCPEDAARTILSRAVVKSYSRGQVLFDHGDAAHSVYIVLDGWVKLYRITPNGAEAVVGVFTRGHSFGEAVALRNGTYPVASEAATDCEVMQIPSSAILNMMRSHPEVCIALLSSTFAHLHALVAEIEQLKAHSGAQRVAQFLLSLCVCEAGPCTVTLPFDKILIAGRIGMKPESLSRAFSRLKAHGVTIKQNHAEIADVAHLREFTEDESSGEMFGRRASP